MKNKNKEKLTRNKDNSVSKGYKPLPKLFEIQINENERFLTKRELASFLNVSVKMIDRKVSMNEIPYLKIGRLVRFSKERVVAWANENTLKG